MGTLGKIISIEDVTDIEVASHEYGLCDGYRIKTDKHEFDILIDNSQQCCESWGYFYLNDNEQEFVGSELREVTLTDTALNTEVVEESGCCRADIQFVNFVTDKGVLQFAVYNEHNGYYGHPIFFIKDKEIFFEDNL